ncbi:hypothetical protein STRDD11_01388 [Streptococcus sp. DD11]|nr:hypothetical protein STRDD11_01388 [Streptococcus sp. DD11]
MKKFSKNSRKKHKEEAALQSCFAIFVCFSNFLFESGF